MYIKSIEINGFKSYGNRTVIEGFDPYFNAITGLNGSGKSNILDSICFVLGISNLSQVRANNLQELVYKNGQAGITKATVSITFDNSDGSVDSHKQGQDITVTRQVIIGGRNKYLINGVAYSNHKIQDFFQALHLNVNNPHFLIMQGRITKVLNMKPMEILSMIEEAAGTRMYEIKKETALKLMKKKDLRLEEIKRLLVEEINPKLEKLKVERKEYNEYTKVCRDLEYITKLHIAWQFTKAEEMNAHSRENMRKHEKEFAHLEKTIEKFSSKVKEISERITQMEKQKEEEVGGRLHSLEASLKEKQMEESKVANMLQNLKSVLKDDCKKKTQMIKNLNEDKKTLDKTKLEVQKLEEAEYHLKKTKETDAEAVSEAEKHLHDVNAGLIRDKEGKAATIASQIITAEEEIKNSETIVTTATRSLAHFKKELAKKQSACTDMDTSYKSAQSTVKSLENEIKALKKQMDNVGYDEGKRENLRNEKLSLEQQIYKLKQQLEEMESRYPQLVFEYNDPEKNFQRNKVYGLACKLINVKDKKATTALEITAGAKLHSIVVEDDKTAKLLLDKGHLRRRCTFIPLNKIIGHPVRKDVLQRAENMVGKKNVVPAISLVDFDPKLLPAMQFVFGNVLVCPDMESAKRLAFADGINSKCVTLDGEVFDPAGTLSGGSMNNRPKLLSELSNMKEVNQQLEGLSQHLREVNKQLQQEILKYEKFESLREQHERKQSEFNTYKAKMERSNYHQQIKEIENLKHSIEEEENKLKVSQEVKKNAEERLKELKRTDSKSALQQELKKAESALKECQKQAAASEKEYKKVQQNCEQMRLEINDIIESIATSEHQIEELENAIKGQEEKAASVEQELQEKKKTVQDLMAEVKAQKSALKLHCGEISKLAGEREAVSKEIENNKLCMQQLQHDIEKCKTDSNNAEDNVNRFLSTYDWIETEKRYFGEAGTDYDFSKYDPRAIAAKRTQLEETKQRLSKIVNVRAQTMLAGAEEEYEDLLQKKKAVLSDRAEIESVIRQLDEKKKAVTEDACHRVNREFGSIFSTLLPGAKAKLVPVSNDTMLEGMEFKIGFGNTWKESLTELSGGQRSLVALSLILAMLLFNPAPIYILDEVDAALDANHTQNIGQMLKKHFQKSQFIVVSLKHGMFDNANVLFKTQFIDGMSTVTRTTPGRKH